MKEYMRRLEEAATESDEERALALLMEDATLTDKRAK